MRKMSVFIAMIITLCAGQALAQTPVPAKFVSAQVPEQFGAFRLLKSKLLGSDNKDFGGTLQEIVIGKDGKVAAYVVGVGGFLGVGEKLIGISPEAVEHVFDPKDPSQVNLKIVLGKEELRNAPTYQYFKK